MARRRKRRGHGIRSWLMFGITLLGLAGSMLVKGQLTESDIAGPQTEATAQAENVQTMEDSRLEVHYLDVEQGDATLILCDGQALLVDAGNNNNGTEVQMYLQQQGIEHLDYVIGTHPDADHIGGLDVILYKFDCDTIFMPDYEKETRTYEDVLQAMEQKGYTCTQPEVGEVYPLGGAAFTIVSPAGDYGENTNDYSVGILLQYGENRFLLTGDAEEAAEADMLASGLDLSADVYKAGHHGSRTASTEAFMEAVNPTYAVISCGEDNSYGHPHAEVLNRFREMGIQVFRTDLQGTIVAVSDGKDITFNMSPDESWVAGEPKKSE